MKEHFFFITVVFVTLCIVLDQAFVSTININNTFNVEFDIKSIFSILSVLFEMAPSVCIVSRRENVFNGLLELFKNEYKSVVLYDFTKPIQTCVGVFVVETNNCTTQDFKELLDSYPTTIVYLIKDSTTADLANSLEACLSTTQTPEVLALSLSDSSLLQLSPVFPRPRYFFSTSLIEVLQRHDHKQQKLDLQGYNLSIGEHDGIYVQVVKEMACRFNFTYSYVIRYFYGIALGNGTWSGDGLGQAIQEGRVEIVATNMWQVPEMYKLADFGPPMNKDKLVFLVMRPEMIDFQWQAILHIFEPMVWFAILGSFVLTVLVYWAGINWDPRPCTESWSGSILLLFGYFTGSTSHSRVNEGNTRFSLTGWAVFSLLITTSLSSGIVTRLTIPSYSPRINTVQQLVEGKYSWVLQFYENIRNDNLLKRSIFDLENHWIQLFEKRYVYMDEEEVVKTAGTDKRMAFVAQTYGNDFVVMETDGLKGRPSLKKYRVSREPFSEAFVTFGVKKQSLLLEPLTKFALLILQTGLMTHWRDEVNRRWPQYDTRHLLIEQDIPTFKEPQGLPLYKTKPVFFLLLFGLGLSSFVFFIEICW